MNLHLKDKYPLLDLATLGTRARRYVRPNVMVSDEKYGVFKEGDILDANATYQLIKQTSSGGGGSSTGLNGEIITQSDYEALEEYEKDTIYFIVDDSSIISDWKFGDKFPIQLT